MEDKIFEELKKRYKYCPRSGRLIRNYDLSSRAKKGTMVSYINSNGYYVVNVWGKPIYAHRFIYSLYYGVPPKGLVIDHINRNKLDNRIKNLCAVSQSKNAVNSKVRNTSKSKTKGVWKVKYKTRTKWVSQFTRDYKTYHVGTFQTKKEAEKAREEKIFEMFNY